MIVYIAGPMTGYPDFNRPLFMRAERALKWSGHIVLNPAYHPDGLTHRQYMKLCLPMVKVADAVGFLPGWRDSKGAMKEYRQAKRSRKQIFEFVLEEATP